MIGADQPTRFEIPARDFDRATTFYQTIFATRLERGSMNGRPVGVIPRRGGGIRGTIAEASLTGNAGGDAVIYLDCDGRLDEIAGRVEAAGGRLLSPRVDLGRDLGSFYEIADSEGNRVGLHAFI